jgi:hypothetical protein
MLDLLVELAGFNSDFGGLRHLSLRRRHGDMFVEPEVGCHC